MNTQTAYSSNFYHKQVNGSLKAAERICPFINFLFPQIKSVVDIGCGCGTFLLTFAKYGKYIKGYDYGEGVENNLLIDKDSYVKADLSQPINFDQLFDLAISLEVAEHVEAKFADIFISNLTKSSNIILFSAAIPKQGGTCHVNLQWPEYWANKFSKYNYIAYDILRPVFWTESDIPYWYRQNMILFVNISETPINKLEKYQNFNCLPLIHPKI